MADYDTVVIGSGAGGLAAALALAQSGMKVLVCEQHEVPGGWTHSFALEGYRFSPGVHYIGGLEPGGLMRWVYEGLGVSGDLVFSELNPDGYDHAFLGEERFDFPKGKNRLIARLQQRFPREAQGIERYFRTVVDLMEGIRQIGEWENAAEALRAAPAVLSLMRWRHRTGLDLIRAHVSDPLLAGILCTQSGDHGLPPSEVSAFVHAGITYHYLNGGYYPVGGGSAIPRAFVRALKRAGGEIKLRARAAKILLEENRAVGVGLSDGTEIRARYVISNADPEVTFGKLIGREFLPAKLRRKVDAVTYSISAVSLFFAVDADLRAMGLDSGNFWLYDSPDIDALYRAARRDVLFESEAAPALFLTVTTLKDPTKMRRGHHTCEAFSFVRYEPFRHWAGDPSGKRHPEYRRLKEKLAERMFRAIEKRFPGMREHVVFWDLGTPLTNEHFLNVTRGSLYGIAKTPDQVGPGAFPIRSPISGLYLAGASTTSHGVAGATMTGLAAARKILGCRTADLLSRKGPPLQVYPAEDPAKWPESLRKKMAQAKE